MLELDPKTTALVLIDLQKGIMGHELKPAFTLITHLHKKGLIPKPDAVDLFQGVLETLENFPAATDPVLQATRQIVDALAQVVATGGTLEPKADRT
jgi:nicotinamidase-related amidase